MGVISEMHRYDLFYIIEWEVDSAFYILPIKSTGIP